MTWNKESFDSRERTELEELLRKNPALRKAVEARPDPKMDKAMRYLSLLSRFDEPLYESVFLQEDAELPNFETVIADPQVEPVPRTENQFWLKESTQSQWLADWQQRPEDRSRWARLILRWVESHDGDPALRLNLLFWTDARQALDFLDNCYNKADAKNDLLTCYALVEQVKERLAQVPPELRATFAQFVARYRGRMLFLAEFQRTAKYFPRPELESALDAIRASRDGRWILYLYAAGGMGKTMFIQRTIAHKLLKESPRALVVRLDLDSLSVSAIAAAPWLLAIEIAHELDEQLASPLFSGSPSSFYESVKDFAPLLYRNTFRDGQLLSEDKRRELTKIAREQFSFWYSFQARCRELPTQLPLLIFIDTLEEASLHCSPELRAVLQRFEELKQAVPQLRLVLSGRMEPFATHFVEYDEQLKRQTSFVALKPFDSSTSKSFVIQFVPNATSDVADAMAQASGGNPFKLWMLCEVVQEHPDITAWQLKEYGEADVAYLIKRVVDRIPVDTELGLRWLLRYGSIPRRLTLSFVNDILCPLIDKALKGEVTADTEDIPSDMERKTWLQNAAEQLDPNTLWKKLTKYASEHSWLSIDSTDPNTAALHPDVVKPMRRLLKNQKVYRYLHQAAADHFRSLRTEQPGRWRELAAAELYHRLELGLPDPIQFIQQLFAERQDPSDARSRLELAEELTKPAGDFSEAPVGVRAWANYEAADAIAIIGGFHYLPEDDRKDRISSLLSAACDLAGRSSLKLPALIWRWREFLGSNYPNTRSAIFELISATSVEDRARYWLLLVDLYGRLGIMPSLMGFFDHFFSLAKWLIRSKRIPAWVSRDRYAASLFRQGQYARGCEILRSVLRGSGLPNNARDAVRVRSRLIKGLILSLNFSEAEEELCNFSPEQQHSDDCLSFKSEIHLHRRDAWAALDCAEKMANQQSLRYHVLKASALGRLFRIDDALQSFAKARQVCIQSGELIYSALVELREAQFNLFEARLPINPVARQAVDVGGTSLWQLELELIRAYQLREFPTEVTPILETLSLDRFPIEIRARALTAGLIWGVLPSSAVSQLRRVMSSIEPVGARLFLLRPPVLTGEGWKYSPYSILPLLNTYWGIGAGGLEFLLLGNFLGAVKLVRESDKALAKITLSANPTRAELALFRQRRLLEKDAPPDPVQTWSGLETEPGLYAVSLIENAERALRRSSFSVGLESLSLAKKVLETSRGHPSLLSRCESVKSSLILAMGPGSDGSKRDPKVSSHASHRDDSRPGFMLSTDGRRLALTQVGDKRPVIISTAENETLRSLTGYSRERTPKRLVFEMSKRWPEVVEELREPFLQTRWNPFDTQYHATPFGLCLVGPQLVAVPWELIFPGDVWPVRFGSGIESLDLNQQLAAGRSLEESAWWRSGGGTIGSVLICSTMPEAANFEKYLYGLRDVYEGSKVRTRIQNGLTVFSETKEDMIHLFSPLRDSPSLPSPQLFGTEWTGEGFGRFLRDRPGHRPLVVLDVPGTSSISETVEQLFARNQFAQALLNTGSVEGVLAAGLNDIGQHPLYMVDTLVKAILTSSHLCDIPGMVRNSFQERNLRSGNNELRSILGPMGTAVFVDIQVTKPWARK